jgi:hypothetical protein
MIKHNMHPKRGETLGRYFVRLNPTFLQQITVLELPESGGDPICIHGTFTKKGLPERSSVVPCSQ